MPEQIIRFINYGTSIENLNLTHALQAVGVKALDAAKNDFVYIVYEENGKMLCSSRGVLSKEVALNAFNWPQEQKFCSIWQIQGSWQFCEPFDLSALRSQRDAAQYMWYIQSEAKLNNERIIQKLNEIFEEHKKTDGDMVMHKTHQEIKRVFQAKRSPKKFKMKKMPLNLDGLRNQALKYYTMFNLWLRDEPIEQALKEFKAKTTDDATVDEQNTIPTQHDEYFSHAIETENPEEDSPIDEDAILSAPALSHVQKIPNARSTDFNQVYAQNNKQSINDIDLNAITAEDLKLEFSRGSNVQKPREISEDESRFLDSLTELEQANNQTAKSPEDFFNE